MAILPPGGLCRQDAFAGTERASAYYAEHGRLASYSRYGKGEPMEIGRAHV